MNKTLRNKALKNSYRLITATLNNENWASPDGHFAVAYPIYEGYRVKKDQTIPDQKPDLSKVLQSNADYTEADSIEFLPMGIEGTSAVDVYRITYADAYWDVNADYYNLVTSLYPGSTIYVDKSGYNFAPIEVKQNDTLVAVLMALKR